MPTNDTTPVRSVNTRYVTVPLDAITPHPENPRLGDVEMIEESIAENGFFGAVVVQEKTGYILVGNHRYLADKNLGASNIPVIYVDVDDLTARKIMLADNRASDRAFYNEQQLLEILQEIQKIDADLTGTGFTPEDIDDLLARLEVEDPLEPDEDDEGEPSESDFWPVIRLKVHPDVKDRFTTLMADAPGNDDCECFASLLMAVDVTALPDVDPPNYSLEFNDEDQEDDDEAPHKNQPTAKGKGKAGASKKKR